MSGKAVCRPRIADRCDGSYRRHRARPSGAPPSPLAQPAFIDSLAGFSEVLKTLAPGQTVQVVVGTRST